MPRKDRAARAEYMREYREKNRERDRQYRRDWRRNNAVRVRAQEQRSREKNKEKRRAQQNAWAGENRERIRALGRAAYKRLRADVLTAYGGRCACCGETTVEFLGIDHVSGGGRAHRATIATTLYQWLRREDFPPGYRVLCHNCNMALGLYGSCPHRSPSSVSTTPG